MSHIAVHGHLVLPFHRHAKPLHIPGRHSLRSRQQHECRSKMSAVPLPALQQKIFQKCTRIPRLLRQSARLLRISKGCQLRFQPPQPLQRILCPHRQLFHILPRLFRKLHVLRVHLVNLLPPFLRVCRPACTCTILIFRPSARLDRIRTGCTCPARLGCTSLAPAGSVPVSRHLLCSRTRAHRPHKAVKDVRARIELIIIDLIRRAVPPFFPEKKVVPVPGIEFPGPRHPDISRLQRREQTGRAEVLITDLQRDRRNLILHQGRSIQPRRLLGLHRIPESPHTVLLRPKTCPMIFLLPALSVESIINLPRQVHIGHKAARPLHRHHLPVIFLQLILQHAIPGKPAQRRIEIISAAPHEILAHPDQRLTDPRPGVLHEPPLIRFLRHWHTQQQHKIKPHKRHDPQHIPFPVSAFYLIPLPLDPFRVDDHDITQRKGHRRMGNLPLRQQTEQQIRDHQIRRQHPDHQKPFQNKLQTVAGKSHCRHLQDLISRLPLRGPSVLSRLPQKPGTDKKTALLCTQSCRHSPQKHRRQEYAHRPAFGRTPLQSCTE